MLGRLLRSWFLLSRPLTLGVRGVVFDRDGRVLLVRHTYMPGWHLPGGGVEPGESAEAALARELVEEAGVEITGPVRVHGVFHNPLVAPRDHVLVFVVRDHRPAPDARPDPEIADARYVHPDELPAGTSDDTRARLREIGAGTTAPAPARP